MQLSVIIINFNVKYFLEQCLLSVQKAGIGMDVEIIVVDNNSTDGSREYLKPKFPGATFKWNNSNPGFGKANNSVLREAKGNYILFLNPDTIIPEDCFSKCLDIFEKNPDCGALGVRMIDGSGKFLKESKRGLPSVSNSFYKMAGLSSVFPESRTFAGYYAGHLKENETQIVDVLAGAFMMLSRKAIELTGGFDERFFMYAEDIDLSYRIIQSGLKNYYFPQVSIIHFKGESTQRSSEGYIKHFYGAMQLFVQKHDPQKKMMQFMMGTAIKTGKILARFKQRFKSSQKKEHKIYNTAVVAEQARFSDCVKILQHADPPVIIVGRVGIHAGDGAAAIGEINQLGECIQRYKIALLVFCEGAITYKQIIALAGKHAGKTAYLFLGKNSKCIVGSDDKNARGKIIALP
ncbi:MAG: glycosyltransferase family 2 protein [Panacibacter sp.]